MNSSKFTSLNGLIFIVSILCVLIGVGVFIYWMTNHNIEHNEYREDQSEVVITDTSYTGLLISLPLMIIGGIGMVAHHYMDQHQLPDHLEDYDKYHNYGRYRAMRDTLNNIGKPLPPQQTPMQQTPMQYPPQQTPMQYPPQQEYMQQYEEY